MMLPAAQRKIGQSTRECSLRIKNARQVLLMRELLDGNIYIPGDAVHQEFNLSKYVQILCASFHNILLQTLKEIDDDCRHH
jgi:hypothetical protein